MTLLQKTVFISDLHLDENQPQITTQFLKLLQQTDQSIDAIYILGDLFEAWIGDDDVTSLHQQIMQALHSTTERIPIYILHGNRDFLLGKKFFADTGCQFITDETKINLYGTDVLLMHGDTLCTRDLAYLKARKILRNTFVQKIFLLLPLSLRRKIATHMRAKSMAHTSKMSVDIMDVTHAEVVQVMQKHKVNYLIHGHTHRPAFHNLAVNNKPATRIVLGAWHERSNMLVWDELGNKEWIEINA